MSNQKVKEKQDAIIDMVSNYCDDELNEEYKNRAVALVEKMGDKEDVPFKRGKLEIWASAVIYSLGQINFLFDKASEPYKTPDDICNYFETKKATVSQKAKVIRDMFNMESFDEEFSVANQPKDESVEEEVQEVPVEEVVEQETIVEEEVQEESDEEETKNLEEIGELLNDPDALSNQYNYHSDFTTLKEFEEAIKYFEQEKGEKYFEENKGNFWTSEENKQYMQDLLDYGTFLWDAGQKERAVNALYRILVLNPGDDQGAKDILLNYLINLNRLDEAKQLIDAYYEINGNWKYSKLLIAIREKENKKVIKELYNEAIETNPYIIDYILNKKQVDELPSVYTIGEEDEAKIYKFLIGNNWDDKKTLKVLRKIIKK